MLLDSIKNRTVFADKYKTHSEAAVISCFFNPQRNPYRTKAFEIFYESIKHLNHLIVECIIGEDEPQLPNNDHVMWIHTRDLLWHKESLLNKAIEQLSPNIKYVFWVDADVIFTNLNWLVQGVDQLQNNTIIQPFEYCVHLEKDELKPSFDLARLTASNIELSAEEIRTSRHQDMLVARNSPNDLNNKVWRSFSANFSKNRYLANSLDYNIHGHVGFAWGAQRKVLKAVPLYDRALIGGADHVIAHAAAGQIPHPCIAKSFTDNLEEIEEWSRRFYASTRGQISYVRGNLYHIWHGDIAKREYLHRIQQFTSLARNITHRDRHGLYESDDEAANEYMRDYFIRREVCKEEDDPDYTSDECIADPALESNETDYNTQYPTVDNCSNHHHENFS